MIRYKTANEQKNSYRSKGEQRIADYLSSQRIRFQYEPPTMVYDLNCKLRVWYPDFRLGGKNGLILEYAGIKNDPDYDRGIAKKKKLYRANGLEALFVYPEDIYRKNWRSNLGDKLMKYRASKDVQSAPAGYHSRQSPCQSYRPPTHSSLRAPVYQNQYH
ncbi:endonuclease I [Anaerohalosphaera lusitana]|uniref:Endonuclease I n=1 Tax=Anaerohalosphaera lusitana TaxID=1936003 RepID=A0A1U9NLX3_9BACT|nr:endonuclease I [Anaerohalosphaera lusitana]